MREFLRHGSLVFAGTLGANVLFYVSYALVQRGLGVADAGLFMALLAATQLLAIPGNVAATVVSKIAADAAARGERGVLRSLSRQASLLALPLLLLAVLIAIVANRWLQGYFHTSNAVAIAFAALSFALLFPLAPQRAIFQGGGIFRVFVISGIVEAAGKAATGLGLLLWGGGVQVAFVGFTIATGIAFAYDALSGVRLAPRKERLTLPPQALRRHMLGIALPIAGLSAITFADAILVRHYLPATASGLYAVVALVGRAIVTITQFAPTVLMPKAVAAVAMRRSPAPLLAAAAGAAAVVVLPMLLLVAIFPAAIAGVLGGGAFRAAAPLMFPYACAMTALAGAIVLTTYLVGINRHKFAYPLAAICALEILAVVLIHPDVATVVRVVLCGHLAAFACVLTETLVSFRSPQQSPAP